MDYSKMTYNQLKVNFERGVLDPYDLLNTYKYERHIVMNQVRRIEKSDVPFSASERPAFATLKEIGSTSDLLKAYAELNQFRNSGYYSLKERHSVRDRAIAQMREHGMNFVDKSNYRVWGKFMDWFRANNLNKLYGSQDEVVEDFFSDSWEELAETSQTEWMELFEEYAEGLL